jgi:hypothetical protein
MLCNKAWLQHLSCLVGLKTTDKTAAWLFLGYYYINSRTLLVTWPLHKRMALIKDIQIALQSPRKVPPKVATSIIGKVRSAGDIAICNVGTVPVFQPR